MSVDATTMSDNVKAVTVVVGETDANGPNPWTTVHALTMLVTRTLRPVPVTPNRIAAQRRNGSSIASGVWLDIARRLGFQSSEWVKFSQPVPISPSASTTGSKLGVSIPRRHHR